MKKSKLKKILLITGIVIGVFFMAILGYGYYLYSSVQQTAKEVYHPLKKDTSNSNNTSSSTASGQKAGKTSKVTKVNADPLKSGKSSSINILLLGVDQRPGDHGRSDTIIVATLDPKKHSLMMTSIPRDTRIHLSGHGAYSKINAAYAYGNESLAVHTVENYLNIHIPYYVEINMQGLAELVNAVGGVTVNNPLDWQETTFHYKKGILHLNGAQALGYARMRHKDPRGDFGRNQRQRQVIQAVITKGKSLTGVTHINSVLNAVGNNVQTNLTFSDMKDLAMNYRQCRQNIANYEVKGTPKYIGGISWVLVSKKERQHVHGMIEAAMSK